MNKETIKQIRAIVDPDGKLSEQELVQRIEKVFTQNKKYLETTRKRVSRWRAKKKAEQED